MVTDKKMVGFIQSIVQKIVDNYQPEKIILYGSYAYGSPQKTSDIDLLIIKNTTDRPLDRRVTVRKLISPFRKGYSLSPLVITPDELNQRVEMGDPFFKDIIAKGEILYAH